MSDDISWRLIEDRVKDWHMDRFGPDVNVRATIRKFLEEAGELCDAVETIFDDGMTDSTLRAHVAEECADCIIVLFRLCYGMGTTAREAVLAKLAVIEKRPRDRNALRPDEEVSR